MSLMQIVLLLIVVGVVVVLFGFYFYFFKAKESEEEEEKKHEFKDIMRVVKSYDSSAEELAQALSLLKSDFPLIEQAHAQEHYEFIYYLAKHKNATSKFILEADRFLKAKNPEHIKMIERYEKKGLDDR